MIQHLLLKINEDHWYFNLARGSDHNVDITTRGFLLLYSYGKARLFRKVACVKIRTFRGDMK